MKEKLVKALGEVYYGDDFSTQVGADFQKEFVEKLAEKLIAKNVAIMPCKVGDVVYKICPVCNPAHSKSCKECAWAGCLPHGCDIGVRVYGDGSYNAKPLQVVPLVVTCANFMMIVANWNTMYSGTEKEAEIALAEYDAIRNIEDREERYRKYKNWEAARDWRYPFFGQE